MSPSASITILQHVLHGSMSAALMLLSSVKLVDGACHNNILQGLRSWRSIRPCSWADCTAALLSSPAADHLFQDGEPTSYIARQVQVQGTQDGQACTLTMQVVMEADARVIAMPLAVATRLLVLGQVPGAGLLAPEALPPHPFLAVLERWGVRLHYRRETQTDRFL